MQCKCCWINTGALRKLQGVHLPYFQNMLAPSLPDCKHTMNWKLISLRCCLQCHFLQTWDFGALTLMSTGCGLDQCLCHNLLIALTKNCTFQQTMSISFSQRATLNQGTFNTKLFHVEQQKNTHTHSWIFVLMGTASSILAHASLWTHLSHDGKEMWTVTLHIVMGRIHCKPTSFAGNCNEHGQIYDFKSDLTVISTGLPKLKNFSRNAQP